jgi:hypothetical protein
MDIEMEAPIDDLEMMVEAEDEYALAPGGPRSSNDPTAC